MDGREEGGTAEDEKQQFVPPQSNKLEDQVGRFDPFLFLGP